MEVFVFASLKLPFNLPSLSYLLCEDMLKSLSVLSVGLRVSEA